MPVLSALSDKLRIEKKKEERERENNINNMKKEILSIRMNQKK